MNRWTLRLLLLVAGAVFPPALLAVAFVVTPTDNHHHHHHHHNPMRTKTKKNLSKATTGAVSPLKKKSGTTHLFFSMEAPSPEEDAENDSTIDEESPSQPSRSAPSSSSEDDDEEDDEDGSSTARPSSIMGVSSEPQEEDSTRSSSSSSSLSSQLSEQAPNDLLFLSPGPPQNTNINNMEDPFRADFLDGSEPKLYRTTFGGGTSLMFEMIAKRMLNWGNEAKPYDVENDETTTATGTNGRLLETATTSSSTTATNNNNVSAGGEESSPSAMVVGASSSSSSKVLPRWHPHSGISDANPNFRNQAPAMNNQGFAKSIWRNVRKRNKASLWRNALRTYDRMTVLENDPSYLNIQRSNSHHEGAMVACAKLGLWQQALEIYHCVYQVEQESQAQFDLAQTQQLPAAAASPKASSPSFVAAIRRSRIRRTVHVSDSMISSLVGACVRASQQRAREKGTYLSPAQEELEAALRRIPLDTALEVLTTIQETHSIPLVARHINPIASAYQSLGYIPQATDILQTLLSNRTAGEEPEDGMDIFNVYDLCAKDKASYSLLVQGAVVTGDWGAAVDALRDMNEAGLFPKQRHCNIWSEISERQTRPRAAGSWKKKRNDNWVDSIR